MEITKLFITAGYVYSKDDLISSEEFTSIKCSKLTKTSYGSIIINRYNNPLIVEMYPNSISHIVYQDNTVKAMPND